jgi:outer membrane autotransporter protein
VTSFPNSNDFRGRIGARLAYLALAGPNALPVTLWGRVNLWHDFMSSAPAATFATLAGLSPVTLDGSLGGTFGEIDVGVDARVTKTVSLFGSAFADHSVSGASSWSVGGRVGAKFEF